MRKLETLRVENNQKKEEEQTVPIELMNKWADSRAKDRIRYDNYKLHMKLLDEEIKKKKQ